MDSGTTKAPSGGLNLRLVELEAQARHARERYRLYRAKAYGPRFTSAGRRLPSRFRNIAVQKAGELT